MLQFVIYLPKAVRVHATRVPIQCLALYHVPRVRRLQEHGPAHHALEKRVGSVISGRGRLYRGGLWIVYYGCGRPAPPLRIIA